MIPEHFHFLRPGWLLALVPLALVIRAAARSNTRGTAWRRVVDPHLLRHLLLTDDQPAQRWPLVAGALAGAAACVAMAGPTWQRLPQPTFSGVAPTVVVLDLSPSMRADDLAPSRLGRARLELRDLLERSKGGQIGLVLYTDEPFVAAPLTDDARLIEELIPTLESGLMPLRAPRADRALEQAKSLLDQAGAASGRVLLVTGGLDGHVEETMAAARALAASGRTLSVLGAATDDGTTERDLRGRVVTGADGKPAVTKLDRERLTALAQAGGGAFSEIRPDDSDLTRVAPALPAGGVREASTASTAQFDVWRDAGIWLVLMPLLLAPLAFRRGLVAAIALGVLCAAPARADASAWNDLWSRPDQQAQAALAAGDATAAAQLFEHPEWKAAAAYESGSFEEAAQSYQGLPGDENAYNRGNALARAGKLEDALAAYDQVLASAPQHEDAKFNRDLVQRLLDQEREQQQQQQQGQGEQSGDPQDAQGGDSQQQAGADGQQGDAQQDGTPQGDAQPQHGQAQNGAEPQGDQVQASNDGAASPGDPSGGSAGAQDRRDEGQQQADAAAASAAEQPQPEQPEQQQANAHASHDAAGERPTSDETQPATAHGTGERDETQPEQKQASANAAARAPDETAENDTGAASAADDRDDEAARADRELAQRLDQELANEHGDDSRTPQNEPEDAQHADSGDVAPDAQPAEQDTSAPRGSSSGSARRPVDERAQAREQALRSIPDDPGGLLRAKIRRQYAERRYSQQEVTR